MLYSYQKATDQVPSPGKTIPRYLRFFPTLLSALGLGLVASVVWPIGSYNLSLLLSQKDYSSLLSPVTYESFASEAGGDQSAPTLIADVDYTKASNWFTFSPTDQTPVIPNGSQFIDLADSSASSSLSSSPLVTAGPEYLLAIPSLGIKQAKVRSDIDDLAKSLIQYRATASPGEAGTPIIFGHSTLPQFFNPDNYLTIFSTLPTIKLGADIFVDYAGVKYTYRVNKKFEVKPDETWVLRQNYNQKTLRLITCVPPGTKLRRLVVEAELIKT